MEAIFWDFDGTLADSVATNIEVTKAILRDHVPRLSGENLPLALTSIGAYQQANHSAQNWRDLYQNYYGMTEDEVSLAGPMWQIYQESLAGSVGAYPGIVQAVSRLSHLPQAICSQNSKGNIRSWLERADLAAHFDFIVGYGCVATDEQKPHPAGFITALENIEVESRPKQLVYVGDHEADTEFARRSERTLRQRGELVSVKAIAVTWSGATPALWMHQPDYIVNSPEELVNTILSAGNI